jgi:hypothetical protein
VQALNQADVLPGSLAAVSRREARAKTRAWRGPSTPRPAGERCLAVVFLAAVGYPQQCQFPRRRGKYCSRHDRERISLS